MNHIGWFWLALGACQPEAPPLAPGERPNLLLVLAGAPAAPAASSQRWSSVWPPTDLSRTARTALLLGRWPDDQTPRASANNIAEILEFYGYRSHAYAGPEPGLDPAARGGFGSWSNEGGCLDTHVDRALGARSFVEPSFFLVIPDVGCSADGRTLGAALKKYGMSQRFVWMVLAPTEADGPSTLDLGGPGREAAPSGELVSTFDLAPTLLRLAGATPPTDTLGLDLLDPETPGRAGVVQELSSGDLLLHRADARLRVPAARVDSWAKKGALEDVVPVVVEHGDLALAAELEAACHGWWLRRHATRASDRLGGAAFEELQGSGGYWP